MEVVAPASLQAAVNAASSGETITVSGTFNENVTIGKAGQQIIPKPGVPAKVNGKVWFRATATDCKWRVDNDSPGQLGPISNAARVTIGGTPDRPISLTNRNTDIGWTTDRYNGPPPDDNVLEYAWSHHCGILPPQNHQHGGYVNWGLRVIVRHVLFSHNADRAIQWWTEPGLGGQAQNGLIENCMAFLNGQGYSFGGAGVGNGRIRKSIAGHTTSPYSAYSSNGPAPGCVYDDNILWDPPGQRNDESAGVTVTNLRVLDPQLVGTLADLQAVKHDTPLATAQALFRLKAGSPAAGYGPSWLQPTAAPPPEPTPPALDRAATLKQARAYMKLTTITYQTWLNRLASGYYTNPSAQNWYKAERELDKLG